MTRFWVSLALLLACRDEPARVQSSREAVTALCSGNASPDWSRLDAQQRDRELERWLDTHITNREIRGIITASARNDPWLVARQINELAAREQVPACQPIDALAGIRGRNGVDVPAVTDGDTVAAPSVPTIALTRDRITVEGAGRFPSVPSSTDVRLALRTHARAGAVRIAVDRKLTGDALFPVLDELQALGINRVALVITVGRDERAVVVDTPRAVVGDVERSVTAIAVDATRMTVNGTPVEPGKLQRAPRASDVVLIPTPDITVQRLCEVIAAAGGHVTLGGGALPRVEPNIVE